jgi:4'-phosphopantetheinyl transferase
MLVPFKLSRSGQCVAASFAASFQEDLGTIASSVSRFLSSPEISYLETLRFPLRRNSFLLGRYAAKEALTACLEHSDSSRIEIVKGIFEQPIVVPDRGRSAELSLSHSAGTAVAVACAVGHPIGVDLEFIQTGKSDFLDSCFTPQDERLMGTISQPPNVSRFILWSMKEALSKVLRCGLMTPFQVFELSSLSPGGPASYVAQFTNFAQYKAQAWVLDQFVLSIVLPRKTELDFATNILIKRLTPAAPPS